MGKTFIPRSEKAGWGIMCNQLTDGSLWVGKGSECGLGEQLGLEIEEAVRKALAVGRGNRNGRFWVNLKERVVTMQVGNSRENAQHHEQF